MYIEKYWRNYIGGTGDSLNLVAFWNWDAGAEFRISIKKPELQGLRP